MAYKFYTDGSCKNNGKENNCGGWSFLLLNDKDEIIKKKFNYKKNTTNNRMELIALLEALKYSEKIFKNEDFEFYTDSAYIYNCIKDKWYLNWIKNNWKNSKKEPVLNKDLWELIIPYFSKENYFFFKVKGHTGKKDWNNEVDKMAQNAAQYLISN